MKSKGGIVSILRERKNSFSQVFSFRSLRFGAFKRSSRKPLIFALFIFLIFGTFLSTLVFVLPVKIAKAVAPVTYYVDATGGLDTNSGLDDAHAWKTLAKVTASQTTIAAGDSILFKRGETFTGFLTLTKSGSAGNIITYGDYGSGALPILVGTGSNWVIRLNTVSYLTFQNLQLQGSNAYGIYTATSSGNITVSGLTITGLQYGIETDTSTFTNWTVTGCTIGTTTGTTMSKGFAASGSPTISALTISYSTIGPTSTTGIYIAGTAGGSVSGVTILHVIVSNTTGIGISLVSTNSLSVSNTEVSASGSYGLQLINTTNIVSFDYLNIHDCLQDGIVLNGGTGSITNTTVAHSTFARNGATAEANGFSLTGAGSIISISDSIADSNYGDGFNVHGTWTGVIFDSDHAHSNGINGLSADGDGFSCHDTAVCTIKNSISHDNKKSAVAQVNGASGPIFNNLFYHVTNGTWPLVTLGYPGTTATGTYTFENNVVYSADNSGVGFSIAGTLMVTANNNIIQGFAIGLQVVSGTLTTDYNDVYDATTSLYSGITAGAHDISTDPKFVNPTTDFSLQSTSPAIDAGYDTNITTDYIGKQRYDVSGVTNTGGGTLSYYDIGAYEYIVPSAPVISSLDCPTQTKFCYDTTPDISISDPTSTTSYYYLVDQTVTPSIDAVKAGTLDADSSFTVPEGQIHPHATFYVHVIAKNLTGDFSTNYGTYKIISRDRSGSVEPSATVTEPSTLITPDSAVPATEDIITEIVSTFQNYKASVPEAVFISDLNSNSSSVNFDASGSTSNKGITSYEWDFGDGQKSNSVKTDHKYSSPGRYTVTLVVTDQAGNKNTTTKTVDIKPVEPSITNIVSQGTNLLIEGRADADTTVYFTIHSNPFEGQVVANNSGKWSYTLTNASDILGLGDHTIYASSSLKIDDQTSLESNQSKTYDFKVSLDDGKLKVETQKTKTWQMISGAAGLIIVILLVFLFLRKKRHTK